LNAPGARFALNVTRKHRRQEVMNMRRTLFLGVMVLLAGGLSAPAFAQAEPQVIISHEMTTQGLDLAELRAFDQVATANPAMSRRLAANPYLANSDSFVRKWADLNDFFAQHPGSKERFLEDPGNYLPGVRMYHSSVVITAHKKKAAATPEAAPSAAAPGAPPAAPEPAAPPSNP
jgi:hypothetical protein